MACETCDFWLYKTDLVSDFFIVCYCMLLALEVNVNYVVVDLL